MEKGTKEQSGKKIAKNTLALYIRMTLMMFIMLYTSRVVLDILGVSDYGVYSVVAGFVTMFTMISAPLSQAISRFLTFEMGKGDNDKLARVFITGVNIQLALALLLVIIVESFGLWFLYNELVIPEGRMNAAFWVLQFGMAEMALSLLNVPYEGVIISHEKMTVFAYISIIEGVLKLLIVYLLYISPWDKLVIYALLLVVVSLFLRGAYIWYCRTHFEETRYRLAYDKSILKEMAGYAGWNFMSYGATVLNTQGVNLLFNIFFGVTTNAARGIATRVETAVARFANSFTTAINPQIIKRYANGELKVMETFVTRGAKYSFFLMLYFALPLIYETETILNIWLAEVPENTALFIRLSVIGSCVTVIGNTSSTAIHATGKIKTYSILTTFVIGLVFPSAWVAYKIGAPVEISYYLYILFYAIAIVVRLFVMKHLIGISIVPFFSDVLVRIVVVTLLALVVPTIIVYQWNPGVVRMLVNVILTTGSTTVVVAIAGMTREERNIVLETVRSKLVRN